MKTLKKGDKVMYGDIPATIIDTNIEDGKEYTATYKIEIYTNYQQRFWVHNKELTEIK